MQGTHTNKANKDLEESRCAMDSQLRRIVQALRNSSQQSQKYFGLTSAQFFILRQIESQKSLSMNSLADLTFTHQSTISEAVGRLVLKGFVTKGRDLRTQEVFCYLLLRRAKQFSRRRLRLLRRIQPTQFAQGRIKKNFVIATFS